METPCVKRKVQVLIDSRFDCYIQHIRCKSGLDLAVVAKEPDLL